MKRGNKGIGDIISTITVAVLLIVIILLVVFSASSYRRSTESQEINDNRRAVLSYVITAAKDHAPGAVTIKDFAGSPGIAIAAGAGFEQKIYCHDGKLLEEFSRDDMPAYPDDANEIGTVGMFEPSFLDDEILEIKTDLGTVYVDTVR